MSILTNWGYTLQDADAIPEMMTAAEYRTLSGRSDPDERVNAEIAAADAAIRNFVGWHLAPAMTCRFETIASDRRIVFAGSDMLIQLPARLVSAVSSVTIQETAYDDYFIDPAGLLRVFGVCYPGKAALVTVEYTAGLADGMAAPIKELIAHRVTHALAVPAGITSEASGGVSVTYNANWINNSRATALAGDNKELLVPYRVLGVF